MSCIDAQTKAVILEQIVVHGAGSLEIWASENELSYAYLRLALREMDNEGFIDLSFNGSKDRHGFREIQEIKVLA